MIDVVGRREFSRIALWVALDTTYIFTEPEHVCFYLYVETYSSVQKAYFDDSEWYVSAYCASEFETVFYGLII